MPVIATIRIGQHKRTTTVEEVEVGLTKTLKIAAGPAAAKEIGAAIMKAIADDLIRFSNQIGQVFTSATGAIGGNASVGMGDLRIPFAPLAESTIDRKSRHGGANNDVYYRDTGALRSALEANLPSFVASMFDVHVRTTGGFGKPRVYYNVFRGGMKPDFMINAMAADNWRDAGQAEDGMTDLKSRKKLVNNPRHWLGPALAYWTMVEAHRVASEAVYRVTGK